MVSKDEFLARQSEQFVDNTFQGSLPKFLTAFTSGRKLSDSDVEELKKIIEENR